MSKPSTTATKQARQMKAFTDTLGKIGGKTFDQWPAWEGKGLPTRENCDLTNPRQALLWTFTAMPGVQGAPLPLPTEYWEMVSWRQWMLGIRPVRKPKLKYQAPRHMTADRFTAAGRWVDPSTPDLPRATMKDLVSQLGQTDKADLKKTLLEEFGLDGAPKAEAPDGYLQVSDLARRLEVDIDQLVGVLDSFGMKVEPASYVGQGVADRIINHLGLDD
ncbi:MULTISPECIES: phage gene 29 protein family protein [Rhodococcus]|uniref:phage gene 29 protein family protein n=1 Tax=Rhodococcus TaxID=1827 RepID=UPI001E2C0277|nr:MULTISPECIES: DUF2744 domain-containing protein [Rhodococcus]BDB58996.1 hypothetical protein RDE2_07900 [Rhodococcus sp. RDE2]